MKVSIAYSDLDLKDIVIEASEQEEEEEGGEEVEVLVVKAEEVEAKEVEAIKDAKKMECVAAAIEKTKEGMDAPNEQPNTVEVTMDNAQAADSVWETMAMAMAKLNVVIESIKVGSKPSTDSEN